MELYISTWCSIKGNKVMVNDRLTFYQENISKFADFAKTLFKQSEISYSKFYKMDNLGKLGFLTAELALREHSPAGFSPERIGVVLSNSGASMDTDLAHQETIRDRSAYFPSPSVFVYTLPNIVIGEICIRHGFKGENAFLVSETPEPELIFRYVNELFENDRIDVCLCGWTDILGGEFSSILMLVDKVFTGIAPGVTGKRQRLFNMESLNELLIHN